MRRETLRQCGATLAVVLSLSLLQGCSKSSLDTTTPRAADFIVDEVAEVRVQASLDGWAGERELFNHVSPVHLEITNAGGKKLRISYQDLELHAADGTTYQALPLYHIGGTPTKPVIVTDWDFRPTARPGFYAAPYTAPFYPGVHPAYEGNFEIEPDYYTTYYQYWARLPAALPSAYMIEQSLPEGVLGEHARVEGWVYFEKLPEGDEQRPVYLNVALVNPDDGERIGRVRLPIRVEQ
jgi:hypothetical protein